MSALLGLFVVHFGGALALALVTGAPFVETVRSPSAAWVAIAGLYAGTLGLAGALVLILVAVSIGLGRRQPRERPPRLPWAALGLLALLVLARPMMPTQWDEFVWLAKARLESLGFGASVAAALDPQAHVIPPGYPPLWPAAVGWLSLGRDELATHVVAGSLLVLLCVATAVEGVAMALAGARPRAVTLAVLLVSAPFVWVHLRSTYVDLPVGLLAVALLANLLVPSRLGVSSVLALVLVAVKDEGIAHVLAASLSAVLVRRSPLVLVPAATAVVAATAWRMLAQSHGVVIVDHAFAALQWGWVPTLGRLLALHATDVWTWGVFWAVTPVVLFLVPGQPLARASRLMLALDLGLLCGALLVGPERVRVFAENGTLLNRLLVQLWPTACLTLLLALDASRRAALLPGGHRPQVAHLEASSLEHPAGVGAASSRVAIHHHLVAAAADRVELHPQHLQGDVLRAGDVP